MKPGEVKYVVRVQRVTAAEPTDHGYPRTTDETLYEQSFDMIDIHALAVVLNEPRGQ